MVYNGVVQWMFKWQGHGSKGSSGLVGHCDLWQQIHTLFLMHGDTLQFIWVPLHVTLRENEHADKLAEKGRLLHPHNDSQKAKRRRLVERKELWHALGLAGMLSETESRRSTPTSDLTSCPGTPQAGTPSPPEGGTALHSNDLDGEEDSAS
mmetsp:Transcript_99383/g.171078  ORF Transcript_99383/g.171078 Transcript_99383/m.171078 type:complete len:151 (-) Transcript_99383:366-818(-)